MTFVYVKIQSYPFNGKSLKKLRGQQIQNDMLFRGRFKLKTYNNLLLKIYYEYIMNVRLFKKFSSKPI